MPITSSHCCPREAYLLQGLLCVLCVNHCSPDGTLSSSLCPLCLLQCLLNCLCLLSLTLSPAPEEEGRSGSTRSEPGFRNGDRAWGQTVPAVRLAVAVQPDAHPPWYVPGLCPHRPGFGHVLQSHLLGAGSAQVRLGWRCLAPASLPFQYYQDQLPPLWRHRQGLNRLSSMTLGTQSWCSGVSDFTCNRSLLIGIRM